MFITQKCRDLFRWVRVATLAPSEQTGCGGGRGPARAAVRSRAPTPQQLRVSQPAPFPSPSPFILHQLPDKISGGSIIPSSTSRQPAWPPQKAGSGREGWSPSPRSHLPGSAFPFFSPPEPPRRPSGEALAAAPPGLGQPVLHQLLPLLRVPGPPAPGVLPSWGPWGAPHQPSQWSQSP